MKTILVITTTFATAAIGIGCWHLISLACLSGQRPGWFLAIAASSITCATLKSAVRSNELVEKLL